MNDVWLKIETVDQDESQRAYYVYYTEQAKLCPLCSRYWPHSLHKRQCLQWTCNANSLGGMEVDYNTAIHFIKPCRHPDEDHRALTPAYAVSMLNQGRIVQINLDNCTLQRMEKLPLNPSLEKAEELGLLPLIYILKNAPVALSATGVTEMPDRYVSRAKRGYERFCTAFWPNHHNDIDATNRDYDESSEDRWVEFSTLSESARCTYGLAYVSLLQMQNIQRTYSLKSPVEKLEIYLHSIVGMLDIVSAFELEIAKYAFWSISANEINQLPDRVQKRRADIKSNFTKLKPSVSKCRRFAFNGAMDLHWLSSSNLSEDLEATIRTDQGEFALDNWVGTNDVKLYRICRDLHSVPLESSTMKGFCFARERELAEMPYWCDVDRLSKDALLHRKGIGYRELGDGFVARIDAAVQHIEEELLKVLPEN